MRVVVQKFGGTSVATENGRQMVREKIKQALVAGQKPVVVVSAMGRRNDPYATDTIIDLLKKENPTPNKHELDFMMCCGEMLSAGVMAAGLQQAGLRAIALTGGQAGIITDDQHGTARILKIDTKYLLQLVSSGVIPVVCGFQGRTEDSLHLTTLGRGGSDTTAAALGAALDAELVEIYTDVDGIMTADPRMVDSAQILDAISYGEICQLAQQGAKVIHPRAVEIAMQKNIPMVVKSTFSNAPGTLISNTGRENVGGDAIIPDRVATGVTYLQQLAQVTVPMKNKSGRTSVAVFQAMADQGINVDCLSVQPEAVRFNVEEASSEEAEKTLAALGYQATIIKQCAKVTVVGGGMREVPGVMATFVSALADQNIAIYQTVDSNTSISAIIAQARLCDAVRALHAAFEMEKSYQPCVNA